VKRMFATGLIAIVGITVLQPGNVEARRFGGGASFGYHRTIPHAPSGSYASTPRQPAGMPGTATPRRGFMGALAGLAFGGVIGALLFGSPFHGFNLFDILVICGILLLILSWLRRRTGSMAYAGHHFAGPQLMHGYGAASASSRQAGGGDVPGLDREWFLSTAKQIFVRMQAAWDAKDISDIRRLCTPEIAARIEADMAALGEGRALTEVTTLHGEIAEAWQESGYEWAAVAFRAMLREQGLDASGALSEDVRHEIGEIWIFRHDPRTDDPTWFLAGIQQAG
jgi:predicted lipid-binding transport protein (Tim44 family)